MDQASAAKSTRSIETAEGVGSADMDACIDIYNKAMAAELGPSHWELSREAWRDTFDDAMWTHCLLGKQEGRIVGFILSGQYAGISGGLIQMMAVAPEAQGSGLGRALLAASLESMVEKGCARARAYVRVDSKRTQDFYRGCKGRIDSSEPDLDYYGQPVYRVDFPLGAKPLPKKRM